VVSDALKLVLANDIRADRAMPGFDWRACFKDLAHIVAELGDGDLQAAVNDAVATLLAGDTGSELVKDFGVFFQTIQKPALLSHLHDDSWFARRFIAGVNPEILERADRRLRGWRCRMPCFRVPALETRWMQLLQRGASLLPIMR
jgi:hypothetical protein